MRIAAFLSVAFVLAGCGMGGTKTTTVTVTKTVSAPAGPKKPPAAEAETAYVKYFGTPVSITKIDQPCGGDATTPAFACYALTIKPEFFLVGVPANVAFAAGNGTACLPLDCAPVEDDRYVIPAGTQNLVFILPAKAAGTVLTLAHQQMHTTKATGTQLAALVGGSTTPHLIEPLDSGLWVTVSVDTVTTFAQQFQP
jgi:hypothetical protein